MGDAATWWQCTLKVTFLPNKFSQVITMGQGSLSSFSSRRACGKEKVVCALAEDSFAA